VTLQIPAKALKTRFQIKNFFLFNLQKGPIS
jgi:hypothetical protein